MQLAAVFALHRRLRHTLPRGSSIRSARDVFTYAAPRLSGLDKEHFMVLHLDARHRPVRDDIISVGTLDAAIIHPREVFKEAIKNSTHAIILIHNHPSGDPNPSPEDEAITRKLVSGGNLMHIQLLDHVIIGNSSYYSFKEEQKIP
ncbi:hypothetical protein COY95_00600 [Candidatus Woesearchaeota archaeon CG_4_10_14_0_8_um_filter_47_5]|nr:MAG: hypothetical protein COY95_00600 [Candidatus Woesearchaeota archaeon CG_4_10_14_0_8_um_filter_47_5]